MDDHDPGPLERLVDAGQQKLALFIGESELCCLEGWARIDVETAAAGEAAISRVCNS